jgi:hypothetical protein
MAGHLDELIAVRVAEEVAKLRNEMEPSEQQGQRGLGATYNAAQARNVSTKQKRVILTEADKTIADRRGLDYATYARIYKGA